MAGSDANGVILNADLTKSLGHLPPSFQTFYSGYESAYHSAPNSQSTSGYIAVQFLAAAMEAAKSSDPSAITSALPHVTLTQTTGNIFPTPTTLSFASDGSLASAPFFGAQIQSNKPVVIYPSEVSSGAAQAYPGS